MTAETRVQSKGDVNAAMASLRGDMTWVSELAIRSGLPLKLRFELIKRVSNMRDHVTQLLYDFDLALDSYEQGDMCLHIHGVRHRQSDDEGIVDQLDRPQCCILLQREHPDLQRTDTRNDGSVLVTVGQIGKQARPVASIARLQRLDDCYVYLADAPKVGVQPTIPAIIAAFDGKLRSVLFDAMFMVPSQLKNKVIKRGSHVLNRISNEDSNPLGGVSRRVIPREPAVRRVIIETDGTDHMMQFFVEKDSNSSFQFNNVFLCPCEPDICVAERVHEVYSDYEREKGTDTKDADANLHS